MVETHTLETFIGVLQSPIGYTYAAQPASGFDMIQQKKQLGADFGQRAITGLVGGAVVLLSIVVGRPLFDLGVAFVGAVGGYELYRMFQPENRAHLAQTLAILLTCYAAIIFNVLILIPLVAALFLVTLRPQSFNAPRDYGLLMGALYIGISLGLLVLIRSAQTIDGLAWTLMLFMNNWATDAFALIGGRVAGRHKLAPRISPAKTVEGAAIGLTLGFLSGMAVALATGLPSGLAVIANLVIAVAVEVGDLLESWIKRRLSVKDSGSILPGHGGFLDRMDGTLLAAPSLFVILALALLR